MILLLFVLTVCSDVCWSQYAYGGAGLLPFEPPAYALRRPPPQRRSAIEALERLRLPVARYFPQVDTQLDSGAYPLQEMYGRAGAVASPDLYALPPQWGEEFSPQMELEEPEYGNYEYENYNTYRTPQQQQQVPTYAEEIYPQEPESAEYNDFVESYLLGSPSEQLPLVQRRSEETPPSLRNASDDASATTPTALPPTPQVQVTAVPASPEKKNVKSLVVPDHPDPEPTGGATGQKEEPLFRPLQSSQRTTWSEGSPLSRAKNAAATLHKTPIPLLKQMIQNGREVKSEEDPLMEELSSLKKSL